MQRPGVTSLPDTLLCDIIAYLPLGTLVVCWKVSRKWRQLIEYSKSCWKNHMQTFQLKDTQYDVEDRAFLGRGLELTSETLESLEMSGLEASALLYSIFSYHTMHFRLLSQIDLSNTKIHCFQIGYLIRKCENLIELLLQNCKNVTDFLFQEIQMEADLTGEIPSSSDSLQHVNLSHTSCTEIAIFCLINEEIFPNLISIRLEAIKMSRKDITEILLRRPTVMQLPSPCPYLYGMPELSEEFPDIDSFVPDLTDYMVMASLIGVI